MRRLGLLRYLPLAIIVLAVVITAGTQQNKDEPLPVPEEVERQFEKFDFTITNEEAKEIVESAPRDSETIILGGKETRGGQVDTMMGYSVDLPENVEAGGLVMSQECLDACEGSAPLPALVVRNIKTDAMGHVGKDGGFYIAEGDSADFDGMKIYLDGGRK